LYSCCPTARSSWSWSSGDEVSVAPHNFYSHLATLMSAHSAAVVPNLRIMEIDPETVPWQEELVTVKPRINAGHLRRAATRSSSRRIGVSLPLITRASGAARVILFHLEKTRDVIERLGGFVGAPESRRFAGPSMRPMKALRVIDRGHEGRGGHRPHAGDGSQPLHARIGAASPPRGVS
jgi:hypothetical protein